MKRIVFVGLLSSAGCVLNPPLQAGANITIDGGVISATGGGGDTTALTLRLASLEERVDGGFAQVAAVEGQLQDAIAGRLVAPTDGCSDGKVLGRVGGAWACVEDADTVYSPTGSTAWPGTVASTQVTSASGTVESRLAALEQKVESLERADCPRLALPNGTVRPYTRDTAVVDATVCRSTFTGAGAPSGGWVDSLVRVGDFWIDRYESTSVNDGAIGAATGYGTTKLAVSMGGFTPTANVSWFQAQQLCASAGKRLCTNAEWQLAATDTPDPGTDGGNTGCNVNGSAGVAPFAGASGSPAAAGAHPTCKSRFGAEDMIGNMSEWVADWSQGGLTWQLSNGINGQNPWPVGFGSDGTASVNGTTTVGSGVSASGAPAAIVRGGKWNDGVDAGVFYFVTAYAPSNAVSNVGFRCCASR